MATLRERWDGWVNLLTNLGNRQKDKRLAATAQAELMSREELEVLYRADKMAAKIVDLLPFDMTRKGWAVRIGDRPELAPAIASASQDLQLQEKVKEGLQWARLYGGAGLVLGVDDGRHYSEPLDLTRVRALRFITVLDRHQLTVAQRYRDVKSGKLNEPELYRVYPVSGGSLEQGAIVHESRVIPFHGVKLPPRLAYANDGWGDSVLVRAVNAVRNYNVAHDSVATIISDFTQALYKIKDLAELVQTDEGEEAVQRRMQVVDMSRSLLRAVLLDAEAEDFVKLGTPVSGLADLVDRVESALVAQSDMPHTLLLGESPGASLGEGGDSQNRDWYDLVEALQVLQLQAPLTRIYTIMLAASEGPAKGQAPPEWTIAFEALWQMDEKEMAELRAKQAETDERNIKNKVLHPEEVRQSRFGGGEWSMETSLDDKLGAELRAQPEANAPAPADADLDDEDDGDRQDHAHDHSKKKEATQPYPHW